MRDLKNMKYLIDQIDLGAVIYKNSQCTWSHTISASNANAHTLEDLNKSHHQILMVLHSNQKILSARNAQQ